MKLKFAASAVLLATAFSCSAPEDYAGYVDTKIGSGGHGHVFVGASVPFGLVQLGPTSIPQQWDWCSGYHDSDSTVIGFSHTHLEGTGIGDLFDITVMPVTGSVEYSREGLWSYADRTREVAEPDYYSVPLLRYDILAEMTATSRVGFHRYTFPASDSTAIVFDLENGGCWDKATDTRIEAEGNDALKGWRFSRGWARNQKVFFYAKFSKPFESVENIGQYARVNFDLAEGEKVMLKVAISPVDIDGAKANMAAELPGWDFEKTREAARTAWNRELSKIRIETGDVDERTIFYTALYHTMIQPSEFCDVNGDYRGADGDIERNNEIKQYKTV